MIRNRWRHSEFRSAVLVLLLNVYASLGYKRGEGVTLKGS